MTTIRAATPEDAELILSFIRELAEYEREPDAVKLTAAELLRDGFPQASDRGQGRYFEALIAEEEGEAAGFALFFPVYSTWRGRAMHLEDLFVRPQARGSGAGRALIEAVYAAADAAGADQVYWLTAGDNAAARRLYDRIGRLTPFVKYQR